MYKFVPFMLVFVIFLSACSVVETSEPEPTQPPSTDAPVQNTPGAVETPPTSYAPQPEDKNLTLSKVYVEGSDLLVLESYPPQYMLHVAGNLPNPCHNLRIKVNPPDAKNNLMVEVYSVVDPKMNCIEVIKAFDASVRLDVGLAAGKYAVWVNGEPIGDIDLK